MSIIILDSKRKLTPPPIPGYSFWFRADGLGLGTINSYGSVDSAGSVSKLSDLGGGTIYADQTTGSKQPTLVTSTIGTKNRKAIRFVGANANEMAINNALALTNNIGAITMYTVAKINTGGTTSILLYFSTGASASNSRVDVRSSAADVWVGAGRKLDADSIATVTGNSSTSAYKIVAVSVDYTSSNAYIYENGALVSSNTTFQTDGSTSATNSLSVSIGTSNGGNYLTGDVGEILTYIGYHDATQIAAMSTWLNNFYGL